MSANQLEGNLSIHKAAGFLEVFKKMIPRFDSDRTNARLQNDLERLALSAPHVLSDIGFERDAKACSCGKDVWRRGRHCVTVSNASQTAADTVLSHGFQNFRS